MRVIYHPDAEAELVEAARYYESRVATLRVQFLHEVDRAVAIILEAPKRWRFIEGGVRGYLMPGSRTQSIIAIMRIVFTFLLSSITADVPIIGDLASRPSLTLYSLHSTPA